MTCMLYQINVTKCLSDANYNQSPKQRVANEVLDPVVQKPIDAYPRLKVNQGVYFSTPRCCTVLIIGKKFTLGEVDFEKEKKKQKKLSAKN